MLMFKKVQVAKGRQNTDRPRDQASLGNPNPISFACRGTTCIWHIKGPKKVCNKETYVIILLWQFPNLLDYDALKILINTSQDLTVPRNTDWDALAKGIPGSRAWKSKTTEIPISGIFSKPLS